MVAHHCLRLQTNQRALVDLAAEFFLSMRKCSRCAAHATWSATPNAPVRGGRQFGFNDYGVVLQAVLEGQAVALGWRHIVAEPVAEGRLVRPVTESVTTDNPIYLIAARSGHLRSAAVKLRYWLLAEARGKG